MAKRRKGKSRSKSRPGWLRPPQIDWTSTKQTLMGAAWVTAAIILGVAWVIGVPRLEAYASGHQPAGDSEVRFVDPPAWLAPELEASLAAAAAEHVGADPLRRSDLVAVRDALLATGWFRAIDQVRRVDIGLVEVTARFARPFAVIRDTADRRWKASCSATSAVRSPAPWRTERDGSRRRTLGRSSSTRSTPLRPSFR